MGNIKIKESKSEFIYSKSFVLKSFCNINMSNLERNDSLHINKKNYSDTSSSNSLQTKETMSPIGKSLTDTTDLNESSITNNHQQDYEIHIKEKDKIRRKYYSKLINMDFLKKQKQFHNIFITNWDDSLFPTSYLNASRTLSITNKRKMFNSERLQKSIVDLYNILNENNYDVFILSDAKNEWIEECIFNYLPQISNQIPDLLSKDRQSKIEIIYPQHISSSKENSHFNRNTHSYIVTNSKLQVKDRTYSKKIIPITDTINTTPMSSSSYNRRLEFKKIINKYMKTNTNSTQSVLNIVIYSDFFSFINEFNQTINEFPQINSMNKGEENSNLYIKTIKVKDNPDYDCIVSQLDLFNAQFQSISNSVKSMNVVMKSKKK